MGKKSKGNINLVKSKIKEMEHKFKLVYDEMNKNQFQILIDNIRKYYLKRLIMNLNPGEVICRICILNNLNYLI